MSSNKQSVMMKHTLRELSNRNSYSKSLQKRPYVLALITSHLIGMEPGLLYLKDLTSKQCMLRISVEDSIYSHDERNDLARIIGNDDWICHQHLSEKNKIDIVFLPILSFSLVSDILSFNEQRPFVRLILHSLMTGKKVIALKIGIDANHQLWRVKGLDKGSQAFKRKLKDQMIQLKGLGIELINEDDNFDVFLNHSLKKSIITAETIRYLHGQNQHTLSMTSQTIITPLAKDMARELNIAIITE
ncbi:hypothetical protein V7127_16770 [Bacillus sp. JJ1773]|uniref:hypothetical protein n=1 Tax=Bacillus sp. JJ1773 TaxID=3122965 RepID=UPI002FFFEED1